MLVDRLSIRNFRSAIPCKLSGNFRDLSRLNIFSASLSLNARIILKKGVIQKAQVPEAYGYGAASRATV
jgi:hypothetical protein